MLQAWDGRDGFSSHFLHRRTLDWYMNIGSPFCLTFLVCLASFWDSLSRHNIKWTDWGAAQYLSWGFPCLMSNPKVSPFAACSAGLSVVPIMSTSVMERQGLSSLPVPFPTFDACPGVGPQIRASSAPPGLRMPLHRHLYIPAPLSWQWPGPSCWLVIHDWPTFGAASPSTRTFNPYNGFPWCSGKAVHCSPSSVAGCCPGNYDKFSNSHCQRSQHARVSAGGCRCPPSDGFHTSAWRSLPPAQGFPLPSSSQLLPMSSPSTGLLGAQDFSLLQNMGRLTPQPCPQETAGLSAALSVARSGPETLQDMQSFLVTMQDLILQQVKGLLGVAPPQLSLGPSVPSDMGQDALQQPSPAGDREALRVGSKSGSKRVRESSRSQSRSGDPSLSERRDGQSWGTCCCSLSSRDTPYRSCSWSPSPKRHRECSRSPGLHHSCSLAGSWCVSPPDCRGPAPQPASVHAACHGLHTGFHSGDVAWHLRPDGCPLSDVTPPV